MGLFSRFLNVFRRERVRRDIDEELASHLEEAMEHGLSPQQARMALGSPLRLREESFDARVVPWLESVAADAVFGWRQLRKNGVASAAAVVSLALAAGACMSAFRLIDALLLRPLPVANTDRLYSIAHRGQGPGGDFRISESSPYPLFERMRAAVADSAELIAVSYADRADVTFGSDAEMEKANRQFVSGWMFAEFGLVPAAGRVLTAADDVTPGAHPVAVISHAYWVRRFQQDPGVVGRKVRIGNQLFEIVGVVAGSFIGSETGLGVDFFVPSMMSPSVTRSDSSWLRPLALLRPGVDPGLLRARLQVVSNVFQQERALGFTDVSKTFIERFLKQTLVLEPAPAGISGVQREYRQPLFVLAVFAVLVLLIACANVANLLAAQTAARAKEMALRISIGAGRWRLVQIVLLESLWLGVLAAAGGAALAWWATPFLVGRINPPDNPATLLLPGDWRVFGFGAGLAIGVTLLFGLLPALRASAVRPVSALKGGEDPHSRHRLMHGLIAVQTALCLVVLFAAGLFHGTLVRLANKGLGFAPERLLALETVADKAQPMAAWEQAEARLRTVPGVESVGMAGWPLLGGNGSNGIVWVNGESTEVMAYFLGVSPEWRTTMGIGLIEGRDLRPGEMSPSVALVNETFVRQCLGGGPAVGRYFGRGKDVPIQVVGVVRDAVYRNLREPITATAYVPLAAVDKDGGAQPFRMGSFLVRTAGVDPLVLAGALRRAVPEARAELRVSTVRTQVELRDRNTVRERLLEMLGFYFAVVSLLLAGVGLYGVLDYSVVQRRREIGIRLAIGAPASDIVRRVTGFALAMVLAGGCVGVGMGLVLGQFADSLLYGVTVGDWGLFLVPAVAIQVVALVACVGAVVRAVRLDPSLILRSD